MKKTHKRAKNQFFDARKNQELLDNLTFSRRMLLAFALFFAGILTLLGRAFYLQVLRKNYYQTRSESNRVKLSVLPPVRGNIYDRNGQALSENILSYNLVVNRSKTENLEAAFALLPKYIAFEGEDLKKYHQAKTAVSFYGEVVVREDLNEDEINLFLVNAYRFIGFDVRPSYKRTYPFGDITAHVVGYIQNINSKDLETLDQREYEETKKIGRTGIERFYETKLHGQAGYQQAEISSQGKVVRVLQHVAPRAGEDLHLTLDIALQEIVTDVLGTRRGSAVAIDPRSGEVMALVSTPTYDANWFVEGISQKRYNSLLESEGKPLFNRAINGRYAPASTLKPLVALAALHHGVIETGSDIFCPGSYQIPDYEDKKRFHCWKRSGHQKVHLNRSLVESCDVYYYSVGYQLGIDRLSSYLRQFKLGGPTGLDLPNESSGTLPDRDWKLKNYNKKWFIGDTINSSIGQGYLTTTPLQMAYYTALIASRGQCPTPHLHKSITPSILNIPQSNAFAWDAIQKALYDTVYGANGTARSISGIVPVKVSGKTGTAQVFSFRDGKRIRNEDLATHLKDNSAFIAYAPSETPSIALSVMIENAGGGSEVALPLAAEILKRYFSSASES